MGAHGGRRVQGNLPFIGLEASGGTVMDIEQNGIAYRVHAFTDVGSHDFEVFRGGECDVLVVAGGGSGVTVSGRNRGAGAGAGGVVNQTLYLNDFETNVSVFVGNGGNIGAGDNGENSFFYDITAIGGGGANGKDGGSGAGGDERQIGGRGLQPTSADEGFGNDGGEGFRTGQNSRYRNPGGGGGAGSPGTDGSSDFETEVCGFGGDGINFGHIFGNQYGENGFFAGGGGGGNRLGTPGTGGIGGGGNGTSRGGTAQSGIPNTGGGGGGAGSNDNTGIGGAGGSGIVLVRYPIPNFPVEAIGGTETEFTDDNGIVYRVHTFTDVGSDTFTVTRGGGVEYLVVAGGGGGGFYASSRGGSGAGGLKKFVKGEDNNGPAIEISPGSHEILVGAGGPGQTVNNTASSNGDPSSVFGVVSIGGGGTSNNGGLNGASGGGASGNPADRNNIVGFGIEGQGNDGGLAFLTDSSGRSGGGGGGAGEKGKNATSNESGAGGNGISSNISGTITWYAGGGGGGTTSSSDIGGTGGLGGGGPGFRFSNPASSGHDGTGGGAGGVVTGPGFSGGSGIVIIRYPIGIQIL